jgi:hypothetical protein
MTSRDRNFDHSALAKLPEYHALRQAVDALGRRLDELQHEDVHLIDREAFIEVAGDMARTSYAADCCTSCGDLCWPFAAKIENDWMKGAYFCPVCNRSWTCGYTVNLEMLQGMP